MHQLCCHIRPPSTAGAVANQSSSHLSRSPSCSLRAVRRRCRSSTDGKFASVPCFHRLFKLPLDISFRNNINIFRRQFSDAQLTVIPFAIRAILNVCNFYGMLSDVSFKFAKISHTTR